MKVALYCRVSTVKQELKNQLHELRKFAKNSSWEIAEEYLEVQSGKYGKDERTEFKRMFADASKKKFDLVLFWSLDRFSRQGAGATL